MKSEIEILRMEYNTRCLDGSLLVLKGLNDCATIERGNDGRPAVVRVEGNWDVDELRDAMKFWAGSEAQQR